MFNDVSTNEKLKIIYIISMQTHPILSYYVTPYFVQQLKNGDYTKPKPVNEEQFDIVKTSTDQSLRNYFFSGSDTTTTSIPLEGQAGSSLLKLLLLSGRCHFVAYRSPPLKISGARQGKFVWIKETENRQRLHCKVQSSSPCTVLPLQPLWYIDHESQECGVLETAFDARLAALFLCAPPMTTTQIQQWYAQIQQAADHSDIYERLKKQLQTASPVIDDAAVDYWYGDWQKSHQKHALEFAMGVAVQGERFNLLPALADIVQAQLQTHGFAKLMALPDDKEFLVPLPNGKQLGISMSRLRKILAVLTELCEEDSTTGYQKLRLSHTRALQLNQLQEIFSGKHFYWSGVLDVSSLQKKFQQLQHIKLCALPATFCGTLRHYQEEGVQWLQSLYTLGLSGILADDMGLGKTIQVLAYILLEKHAQRLKQPALIIAPTSLLMNWYQEAKRFTPTLKLLIWHGHQRKASGNELTQYDVIVTSYALLTRDYDFLAEQHFHLLILDEAQYIKNSRTKTYQLVKHLSANQRLCLTGTPMENHLNELWTLFNFLLPGLLGEHRQFQRVFRIPIEKQQDTIKQDFLKQRIAPFFLRRTKQDVLPELPEKIEVIRPIALTDAQHELYENVRVALHEKVLAAIQQRGFAHSRIFILDALLKLRQICCDPRLLRLKSLATEINNVPSAKLELLMEMLHSLLAEGRRIIVFSQFARMLGLISDACQQAKLPYVMLTGKTENRTQQIDAFQSERVPLFLISLKAGGVGLNLTKADTVIHYDPWWNPAAENQATDRAHRIGQDKTVFVYKLITSGTIEEKILQQQREKQKLLDTILGNHPAHTWHSFSAEDLQQWFAPLENF